MKSLIVTAGTGQTYEDEAKRLTGHINRISAGVAGAVPALDLSDQVPWGKIGHPYMVHVWLWKILPKDIDRLVWLDTDTYVTRPILSEELPTAPFSAVRDGYTNAHNSKSFMRDRKVLRGIPSYFNAGVFYATRESIPAFELFAEMEPVMFRETSRPLREQDLLNWTMWKHFANCSPRDCGWNRIGGQWNANPTRQMCNDEDVVVVHPYSLTKKRKKEVLDKLFAGKSLECALLL